MTKQKYFNDIKQEYEKARSEQRAILVHYLSRRLEENKESLTIINRGRAGKGTTMYKNAKTIEPFDLSNWKWIEIKEKNFNCIISLNMVDLDKNSANFHALFDRIGLIFSFKKELNFHNNYIYTSIDLPLDNDKMETIYKLLIEQYDIFLRN